MFGNSTKTQKHIATALPDAWTDEDYQAYRASLDAESLLAVVEEGLELGAVIELEALEENLAALRETIRQAKFLKLPLPLAPTYITEFGEFTFEELHEKTRGYTVKRIKAHWGDEPPIDVDDALQMGYAELYERLQREPQVLADKGRAWIAAFILNSAKHHLHRAWKEQKRKHYLENAETGEQAYIVPTSGNFAPTIDKRIDLEWAIQQLAEELLLEENKTLEIWALYGLTCLQVHASETARLFSASRHSMNKAYEIIRERLQALLQNYKPVEPTQRRAWNKGSRLPFQDIAAIKAEVNRRGITPELIEAVKIKLLEAQPDYLAHDLLGLEGIATGKQIAQFARETGMSRHTMRAVYRRLYLLLALEMGMDVRPKEIRKTNVTRFILDERTQSLIPILAEELASDKAGAKKLIALYGYICNLSSNSLARQFGISITTMQNYRREVERWFASQKS